MQSNPPANYVFVKAGLHIIVDKEESTIQALYTQDLKNNQAYALWNDNLFFLANISGSSIEKFSDIIVRLTQYFRKMMVLKPDSYGHAYSDQNSPETIAFKKALEQNKIEVKDPLKCNKCIVNRTVMKANDQNWIPGYFEYGVIQGEENSQKS